MRGFHHQYVENQMERKKENAMATGVHIIWDSGKQNGNYYSILGLYRENGK